tara:strand:- start:2413 stop:3420 length:1008 start_codon:yes stop_codon:yes gene_type:complete
MVEFLYPGDIGYNQGSSKVFNNVGFLSPFYTDPAKNYFSQRPRDEGKKIEDKSFILLWENEPVIGFIGMSVETDRKTDLLAFEMPCITVENKGKLTVKAAKTFLKKFDFIKEEVSGIIWYRDFLNDGELSTLSRYLLANGASEASVFSQVIDLVKEEADIKSRVRKSYRSLINWGKRELMPKVFGSGQLTWEQMDAFRQLHIREAKRETRSKKSWERQFEMVEAEQAFVVLGHLEGELVSAGLFMHSQTNCYYGISASRRDLFDKPLFHSLMWTAILHAKQLGCRWFESGKQIYPNQFEDKPPSLKELGISEFKAGFGGDTRMFLDIRLDRSKII